MAEWEQTGTVDWLCVEAHPDEAGQAWFGLVLPYGYADESPSELGIGWAAVTALASELRRPRETADLRVVEPKVGVQVNLRDTVVLLTGEQEAVRLGAYALEHLLRDPSLLEPADPPVPASYAWSGWTSELTAWLGMGPAALATEWETAWSGDVGALRQRVASLNPTPGAPAVAWTTDLQLAETVFRAPSDPAPATRPPLTWREPNPTADGPRSIRATYDNNLLTARLPATRAHQLAVRLLAQTVHRNLVEFGRVASGLQLIVEQLGPDLLVGMRATSEERDYDAAAATTAVHQVLEAYSGFTDEILAAELERAQAPEALRSDLNATARAVAARHSDRRPSAADVVAEFGAVTVADLRQAIGDVLAGTLLGVPRKEEPPADRPLWVPPVPTPIENPTVKRRSLFAIPLSSPSSKQIVRATASTLEVTSRTVVRRGQRKAVPTVTAIDLDAVAVRADSDTTWTTLIDRDDRRVTLAWPAYRNPAPLRALVDAATPPPTRIDVPVNPASTKALLGLRKKFRFGVVLQVVVYLGFLALIIWHPVTGRAYQDPVVTTVAAGQLVTLGNGSTVTVSAGRWDDSLDQGRQVVSADVSYCGGGPTSDRNTADDARNYVTPDRFEVAGIAPASRRVNQLEPNEISLEATQLADGQCTHGRVAFQVDASAPVSGTQLRYHNGSGDQITWNLG